VTRELLERLEALYSSVVADVLDRMGYREQVMDPGIRPLYPEARVAGFAFPVQAEETDRLSDDPYRVELESVDAIGRGQVMVVGGAGRRGAYWGELLSTRCRARGAPGVVLDGLTRDCLTIISMRFPVFAAGISPADSYGRVEAVAYDVETECGGVRVQPGDLILGDYDGVVVIPVEVAAEAIALTEEKSRAEDAVRKELEDGTSVQETFRKYGVM
jgi:regulator of RNase E activity RraA